MTKKYILSFDLGTSSLRAVLFSNKADMVGFEQSEFIQYYPQKNYVEHDPEEIFNKLVIATNKLLERLNIPANKIAGIGITNQRETTVIWDKKTGKPIYNAIVWQDSRTAEYCDDLYKKTDADFIKNKTGLAINTYFSASKIKWILDNVKCDFKDLKFGTIDSWILWKLTGGKSHYTDYSNASRTLLFNINTLEWDKNLLNLFKVPENILPEVKQNIFDFGVTEKSLLDSEIPIKAMVGDQQSSLFGQLCFDKNDIKATYGTGCFILQNTGEKPIFSSELLTTIAWGIDGKVFYAQEAAILNCASIINWLKNNLQIIKSGKEADILASSANSSNGVVFIPTFNKDASILGLTLDSNKAHIIRAALESIAFQAKNVLDVFSGDIKEISADGGVSNSDFLMQFQSNLLQAKIKVQYDKEKTAAGAAYMAGIAAGLWDINFLRNKNNFEIFIPKTSKYEVVSYENWSRYA